MSEWVRAERTMAEIREALEMLPSRQRDVVELVSWAGRTEAEAAGALDVPVGTVKSRLSRARRNLADRRVVSA